LCVGSPQKSTAGHSSQLRMGQFTTQNMIEIAYLQNLTET